MLKCISLCESNDSLLFYTDKMHGTRKNSAVAPADDYINIGFAFDRLPFIIIINFSPSLPSHIFTYANSLFRSSSKNGFENASTAILYRQYFKLLDWNIELMFQWRAHLLFYSSIRRRMFFFRVLRGKYTIRTVLLSFCDLFFWYFQVFLSLLFRFNCHLHHSSLSKHFEHRGCKLAIKIRHFYTLRWTRSVWMHVIPKNYRYQKTACW